MKGRHRWSRILGALGLVAMVLGAIDPLEGSLVILPGAALVALGAWLARSRQTALCMWALVLLSVGIGILWGLSAIGGIGGEAGHPKWWAIVLVPYPVGWVLGIAGALRRLRESETADGLTSASSRRAD